MGHEWTGKPVTVLGLSKSGMAAATYLARHDARVFLSETVPASPNNQAHREAMTALGVSLEMGGHSAKCYDWSDTVVLSPGIPPSSQIIQQLKLSGKTLISEVELAYRETPVPFIGITGTNGKTTTTTLISDILTHAGHIAPACGNIGTPIIGLVDQPTDYFIAELSSYQLTFSPTLKCNIALFLNFKPDHLDWHGSVEAYKRAKAGLFQGDQTPQWAILNADDPVCREMGETTQASVLWFSLNPHHLTHLPNTITLDVDGNVVMTQAGKPSEPILNIAQIKLVGAHNHQNVLAAVAAARLLNVPAHKIEAAVCAFAGVEHRLEPVATLNGIPYYNDSKATNPDATLSALAAFVPRQVVLIAGGRDKNTPLDEFVQACHQHVKHVVLIGEAATRFEHELTAHGYPAVSRADSLEDAIHQATLYAHAETPVLFSPACASFDMFENFEARGRAFKNIISSLA